MQANNVFCKHATCFGIQAKQLADEEFEKELLTAKPAEKVSTKKPKALWSLKMQAKTMETQMCSKLQGQVDDCKGSLLLCKRFCF